MKEDEKTKKREMWTTPGRVPLQMAPDLNWETFKETIKSDLRHRKLFPNDIVSQRKSKDLDGEYGALLEYFRWVSSLVDLEPENARHNFYVNLFDDLLEDVAAVRVEWGNLHQDCTPFQTFEFQNLDDDGQTRYLEDQLQAGSLLLYEDDKEVLAHPTYGPLFHELLDGDKTKLTELRADITVLGLSVLCQWGEEVFQKYSPLFPEAKGIEYEDAKEMAQRKRAIESESEAEESHE